MWNLTHFLFHFIPVPNKPRITHCTHVHSSSLRVNWEAPTELNGRLLGYQLIWQYNGENFTKNITTSLQDPMSALVTGLSKCSDHVIILHHFFFSCMPYAPPFPISLPLSPTKTSHLLIPVNYIIVITLPYASF